MHIRAARPDTPVLGPSMMLLLKKCPEFHLCSCWVRGGVAAEGQERLGTACSQPCFHGDAHPQRLAGSPQDAPMFGNINDCTQQIGKTRE